MVQEAQNLSLMCSHFDVKEGAWSCFATWAHSCFKLEVTKQIMAFHTTGFQQK
jgi:hypothetical protein